MTFFFRTVQPYLDPVEFRGRNRLHTSSFFLHSSVTHVRNEIIKIRPRLLTGVPSWPFSPDRPWGPWSPISPYRSNISSMRRSVSPKDETPRKRVENTTRSGVPLNSFLRGLFLEGRIFGGAYIRREVCNSKSARLILGRKFASQNRLG